MYDNNGQLINPKRRVKKEMMKKFNLSSRQYKKYRKAKQRKLKEDKKNEL